MTYVILIAWLISVLSNDTITPGSLANFLGHITVEQIQTIEYAFIQSSQNDINPEKFIKLMWCESQFEERGGDWNEKKQRYDSWGCLQYQKPTFNYLSKDSGIIGEYKDCRTQIDLTVWTINNDKKGLNHWYTCSRRAGFFDYLLVKK